MIILWVLAFALAFVASYYLAEIVQDVLQQREMNAWRKELDLPVRPVRILTKV